MGVSNYDTGAATKKYEQKYTLSTTKGVKTLLKDVHAIKSRAFERGDMAAIDLLIDLHSAIDKAKLTDKQLSSIRLYYFADLDLTGTAKRMDCDSTTISRHVKAALKRIKNVYQEWEYN